jgi:hypothetical protein
MQYSLIGKTLLLFTLLVTMAGALALTSQAVRGADDDTAIPVYLPMLVQTQNNPTGGATGPDWLVHLNQMRSLGGLPELVENQDWSQGCGLHSRYMVMNDIMEHDEDPGEPYYTTAGDIAAGNSNLMMSSSSTRPETYPIDMWLTGPFHGLGLLDPELGSTGFGLYREEIGDWHFAACLDVLRGLGPVPASVSFPIMWPGPGQQMPFNAYYGGEFPDPLSACPGYTVPSGPPIYLQLGQGSLTPVVSAHSLTSNGQALEHCLYDEASYNGDYRDLGRAVLDSRDAVVLIPRAPLVAGSRYTVAITANGQQYSWSFTAGSETRAPLAGELVESQTGLAPEIGH